jgi:hypothetical protein
MAEETLIDSRPKEAGSIFIAAIHLQVHKISTIF